MRKGFSIYLTKIEPQKPGLDISSWTDLPTAIEEIRRSDLPDDTIFDIYRAYDMTPGIAAAKMQISKKQLSNPSIESIINKQLEQSAYQIGD